MGNATTIQPTKSQRTAAGSTNPSRPITRARRHQGQSDGRMLARQVLMGAQGQEEDEPRAGKLAQHLGAWA